MFAGEIRKRRGSQMRGFTQWRWHLEEVYAKINGEMHYLWRAVDHEGEVLEALATKTRGRLAGVSPRSPSMASSAGRLHLKIGRGDPPNRRGSD